MSLDTLLSLEARLLIARYGRQRVLETLATISEVDLTELQREMQEYEDKSKHKKPTRRKRSVGDLLKKAHVNEKTRPLVEKLAYAYESKEFLPELKKVKRFLESQGITADKLRSRTAALPKVIDVLSHQPNASLEKLNAELESNDKGDLEIIADQILGQCTSPGNHRVPSIAEPEQPQFVGTRRKGK